MISNYKYLNTKTFEIENIDDIVAIDERLINTISILNKKGYYTEFYNIARISKTFLIGSLVYELNEEGLITINDKTKDKIKNIINQSDLESTAIHFKENYEFASIPAGFKYINSCIMYPLSTLKNNKNFELKTLVELDKEQNECISILEQWAINLPIRED